MACLYNRIYFSRARKLTFAFSEVNLSSLRLRVYTDVDARKTKNDTRFCIIGRYSCSCFSLYCRIVVYKTWVDIINDHRHYIYSLGECSQIKLLVLRLIGILKPLRQSQEVDINMKCLKHITTLFSNSCLNH